MLIFLIDIVKSQFLCLVRGRLEKDAVQNPLDAGIKIQVIRIRQFRPTQPEKAKAESTGFAWSEPEKIGVIGHEKTCQTGQNISSGFIRDPVEMLIAKRTLIRVVAEDFAWTFFVDLYGLAKTMSEQRNGYISSNFE